MNLGAFSVSLAVKDLEKSIEFYQKLGFSQFGGDNSHGWAIMKNGDHLIGLFQGMFEKNMLTFNPGWDQDGQPLESFDDIRVLKKNLQELGVTIVEDVDESGAGPASFVIEDPDGNPILIDQHL